MGLLLRTSLVLLWLGTVLTVPAPPACAEEKPSPGPPWHTEWPKAKAEALRTGRPIFAYFTKKH